MSEETSNTREILSRRGVVSIGEETLRSLFDLPEDVHITYVDARTNRFAIQVGVVSERFDVTDELAQARHLGWATAEQVFVDGKVYWRLGVDWDAMVSKKEPTDD